MTARKPTRPKTFSRSRSGRWHRAVGAFGGLVFVFMALTGVAIHHSDGLRLDSKIVRARWLLSLWGVTPTFVGVETDSGWVTTDGEAIFLPAGEIPAGNELVAAIAFDGVLAIASADRVFLLTESGDILDQWSDDRLPGTVLRLGLDQRRLVVDTVRGAYIADQDLMELTPFPTPAMALWAETPSPVPPSVHSELALHEAGPGLSVERILLDLHSGRAFGVIGPYLMDLAGLALSLVVFTGLLGWWRRWGNGRPGCA